MSVIKLLRDRLSAAKKPRVETAFESHKYSSAPHVDVEVTKKLELLKRAAETREKVAQAGEQLGLGEREEVLRKIELLEASLTKEIVELRNREKLRRSDEDSRCSAGPEPDGDAEARGLDKNRDAPNQYTEKPHAASKPAEAAKPLNLSATREAPAVASRPGGPHPRNELFAALSASRSPILALGLASSLINILYLTGSFYMLEVYDRVLSGRSVSTLVGLSILAMGLYAFQGFLDLLRGRVLIRIGRSLAQSLSFRVFDMIPRLALTTGTSGDGLQPLRDLDQVRSFLSSPGPSALLDLPWMPFYIGICFFFHFWIGVAALIGAVCLITLTCLTESFTREPIKAATGFAMRRNAIAESARRNAEVLQAMGMAHRFAAVWDDMDVKYLDSQQRASDVGGQFGALSKVMRMALQSSVLGVGAYLVIMQQASGGVIIAGSILAGRALAPVDLAIAYWRHFVAFRQSWRRLQDLLARIPMDVERMALPKPRAEFVVESVSVVPPGDKRVVVQDITLRLGKGDGLGIIGPSASGKSSLARALVGAWRPLRGTLRLDGAALEQWPVVALGQHIGYLPQDVELLSGSVAQNIARFTPNPNSEDILAAARAAGVHDLILRLPDGYETQIGEGGASLSAGQRQRIALARALFGEPFLVVLDEPNSNLDAEGEEALTKAILGVRTRGGIVVIIAHRPSALAGVDTVMVMVQGKAQMIGPKEKVLSKIARPPPAATAPGLRVVADPGGAP